MKAQLMAAALIAVMLACAMLPAASAADVAEYDIDMRSGDVFTYTPETSIPAKLDFASTQDWASWNDGNTTLTVSFPEPAKDRQLLIRAVWTSDEGNVSQTAFQAINFRAFDHVTIDGQSYVDTSRPVAPGAKAGAIVYKPTVNDIGDTVTVLACEMEENPYIEWDSKQSAIVVKADVPLDAEQDIVCTITATNTPTDESSTLRAETATAKVIASVGADMVITSPSAMETYKQCKDDQNVYTITTNYDDYDVTVSVGGDIPEGFATVDGDKIVIDPAKATVGFDESRTYTMTVTATAGMGGAEVTATKDVTVTVWKSYDVFMTPMISDVAVQPKDGETAVASLSASIIHVTHVVADWGDGSSPERLQGNEGLYLKDHEYDTAKSYVISITAVNVNKAAVVHYVLYNAADGTAVIDYDPDGKSTSHSPLWMVFAAFAVLLAVVYARLNNDLLIIGGAVVSALLSVTIYIGWI